LSNLDTIDEVAFIDTKKASKRLQICRYDMTEKERKGERERERKREREKTGGERNCRDL
jgi:hypothetical protein